MVKVVGKYELGRTLGEGTFGKVKYAVNSETKTAVAIKVLDKEKIQKQNMGNQIKREISIMKLVKHKYIVEMIEVLASKSKIFIVLELVTGGELFDKIVRDGRLSEEQALFYFGQLLEGVEYCHGLGVCHRDLKPENLLLDEHGNLKISDFGLSSLYVSGNDQSGGMASRTQLLHTTCGTPNYVAPEVLADQGYDGKKADVWSMGVILYVLLAGFLPFDEKTIMELFQKIQNTDYTFPSWFSKECREIIGLILVADPKKRISSTDLKAHSHLASLFKESSSSAAGSTSTNPSNAKVGGQQSHDQQLANNLQKLSLEAQAFDNSPDSNDVEDDTSEPSKRWTDVFSDVDQDFNVLKKLNAFDLVNQCGGFGMDRIFGVAASTTLSGKANLTPSGGTISADTGIAFGKNNHNLGKSGCYNFTSSVVPVVSLIEQVYAIVSSCAWEQTLNIGESKASGSIRATKITPKGMIGIGINIYILCDSLSFLQIVRGKGDRLEWNAMYQDLVENKLKNLINQARDGEEAKSSSQRIA